MRRGAIDLTREHIAFCYRPSLDKLPVRKRQSRTWPKGIVSIVAVSIVAAVLVAVMLFAPTRMALSKLFSSIFAVRQIVVETTSDLNTGSALNGCSSSLGRSLFSVSAQEITDLFESMPSVRDVEFKKLFPSTLVVSVRERTPRFTVRLDGKWWGISDDGVILSLPSGRAGASQPSVEGLEFDCNRPGGKVKNAFFTDLVVLCDSMSTLAPGHLGPDSRIEVVDRIEVLVLPEDGKPALVFSLKEPKRQIQKYVLAAPEIARHKGAFGIVDLRFRGQIVLRKNRG